MTVVQNGQISTTRLWSCFEIIATIKILVIKIVSSQRIIYINIHTYSGSAGIKHNGLYPVNCVCIVWRKNNGFWFPQFFYEGILWQVFLHDEIHVSESLFYIKYLLNITLTNKGPSIVQKLFRNCMCDVTH